jgi:hypothetical protein
MWVRTTAYPVTIPTAAWHRSHGAGFGPLSSWVTLGSCTRTTSHRFPASCRYRKNGRRQRLGFCTQAAVAWAQRVGNYADLTWVWLMQLATSIERVNAALASSRFGATCPSIQQEPSSAQMKKVKFSCIPDSHLLGVMVRVYWPLQLFFAWIYVLKESTNMAIPLLMRAMVRSPLMGLSLYHGLCRMAGRSYAVHGRRGRCASSRMQRHLPVMVYGSRRSPLV